SFCIQALELHRPRKESARYRCKCHKSAIHQCETLAVEDASNFAVTKLGEAMARSPEARDDEQQAGIQAILRELPEDHPARQAHRAGADTTELTQLVDREDLLEKLNQAWQDWYMRRLRRQRLGSA